ncbi:SMEK domain-containing protein [Undibacterium amnicola]|uniref:SMEK domain-containing protein n=1 Tax=Undibacterium amnicola TaxID=1834038 RepID=A0ABR6XMZ8_9BURK|nr:ABC-three component system protein [Undibacterium amnicola]MBC3830877.1 SMEK domain-containing protein [Undibacterium amnicola]
MNRSSYWNLCEEKLSILCTRVELRGKLNILDFHLHAEDFYSNFLNVLFGYSLKNINQIAQNAAGIDLVDSQNLLILQVSSTATKSKIESALGKDLAAYAGYNFKFISISKDASDLRKQTFLNPHGLIFSPANDIYDVKTILSYILHLKIEKQREIYDFLKQELKSDQDLPLVETNLAEIINILAKENLVDCKNDSFSKAFEVDQKITFNNLAAAATLIEDYKLLHPKIDKIYSIFDTSGQNKSNSVLNWLRQSYIKLSMQISGDELFFEIVEQAIKTIKGSSNYADIPLEELTMCVNALAVDAFIRCKIFKVPQGLSDAIA